MIVFPNAKINIGLRILRRRSDGYHDIESIFYPVGLRDMLEILPCDPDLNDGGHGISVPKPETSAGKPGTPISGRGTSKAEPGISVSGFGVPATGENLCLQAAGLFARRQGTPPVRIHLHKKIPPRTGLGGGSSDASFTLSAMNEMFGCGLDPGRLEGYASELGSDCPFFIRNRPCLVSGRGELLQPVSLSLADRYLCIVFPGISIPTSDAYRMVSPTGGGPGLGEIPRLPVTEWKERAVNDFEEPVFGKYPELAGIRDSLYDSGAEYASMSGSGSAVYGIFGSPPVPGPELEGYAVYTEQMA